MYFSEYLTYDDVALVPQFNNIESRTDPDLTTWLTKNTTVGMPLIPSNMDTVIGKDLANVIVNRGGFPIFHRFCPLEEQLDFFRSFPNECYVSIGMNNVENVKPLYKAGAKGVCIDIAHGHSLMMMNLIRELKMCYPDKEIIAGNICTPMAYNDLVNAGADCCKVGIGGGSACSTRVVTGFGVPQFSAIYNISEYAKKLKVPIIADGGIRNSRDVVLSLAAGASTVMIGNLFAKTFESAAKKYEVKDGIRNPIYSFENVKLNDVYVHYRGQASADFQNEYYGGIKKGTVPEGVDFMAKCTG